MKEFGIRVLIASALAVTVYSGKLNASPATERLFEQVLPLVPPAASAPQELQVVAGDRIVAIGDSITAEGSYLRYVEQVLAANYSALRNLRIVSAGMSGYRSENLVSRFDVDVLARQPTIVLINIGVNDVWLRLKEPPQPEVVITYRENLAKLVSRARQAGIHVILLSPTILQEDPNSEGNLRLASYALAMGMVAHSYKCQFVNLRMMFLHALETRPAETKRWLTTDGIHMQPLGSAIMALGVLRALGVPDAKTAATEIVVSPPK